MIFFPGRRRKSADFMPPIHNDSRSEKTYPGYNLRRHARRVVVGSIVESIFRHYHNQRRTYAYDRMRADFRFFEA